MKKNIRFGLSILGIILLSGCTPSMPYIAEQEVKQEEINHPPEYNILSAEKEKLFETDFRSVALKTKTDPNYQRMGLGTDENKAWFKDITYSLWKKEISKTEYINSGLTRFPNNEYEFIFITENINYI